MDKLDLQTLNIQESWTDWEPPTAAEVLAERAREAAYERALAALPDEEDSSCSEGEAMLLGALAELGAPAPPAAPPAPAALLRRLAAALPRRDTRFLTDYARLLDARPARRARDVDALTEEVMASIEAALAGERAECGAEGAVVAAWLGAAAVWRGPRVPRALPALLALLAGLAPAQVREAAAALHAALSARELTALADACRGAPSKGAASLSSQLLRAALARLLERPPAWSAEPLCAEELRAALAPRWAKLGAAEQLQAAALAGRVLAAAGAGGARGAGERARALLAALPPPAAAAIKRNPDYLKVSIALKTLQNLFRGP